MLRLFDHAGQHSSRVAIVAAGKSYTYADLLQTSHLVATTLLDGSVDLNADRIAFMVSPGLEYVAVQWGIWRAGGIAAPLCITYPPPSLDYVLENTGATIVVATKEYESIISPLAAKRNLRLIIYEDLKVKTPAKLPDLTADRMAMILYTSGTTSLPKGVVTTHRNIEAQVSSLVSAWEWSKDDHIVCVLPLHHVHGIINVISCALWSGATVEFVHPFTAETVFSVFRQGKVNVFMAVPTIYFKLISYWESLSEGERKAMSETMARFRLMVSGSAALPVSIMDKWKSISQHTLLERYGMTEIGMGISNPYRGERKAGYIGQPLPGVSVRLVDEQNKNVAGGQPGEIQIKGDNVFVSYWNNPEATRKSFTPDGWFRTGDVAVVEDGYYRILGRDSVDIIKSGGYKISALEIEEILRSHPDIADCSVVGLPNEEWGELVAAAIKTKKDVDIATLSSWLRERMPAYKTPRRFVIVDDFPRNAMGKVVKNDLKKLF